MKIHPTTARPKLDKETDKEVRTEAWDPNQNKIRIKKILYYLIRYGKSKMKFN